MIDYIVYKPKKARNFEILRRDSDDRTRGLVGEAIATVNNEVTAETVARILTKEAEFFAVKPNPKEQG